MTTQIVSYGVFGNTGQRCLAASLVITVGEHARQQFTPALVQAPRDRLVGYRLDKNVQMGPVITQQSKERIQDLIQIGVDEGAKLLVDRRQTTIRGYEIGFFLRPTVL